MLVAKAYLTLINPARNAKKHYFAGVSSPTAANNNFEMYTSWGRIGTTPTTKIVGVFTDEQRAIKAMNAVVLGKTREGYTHADLPPGTLAPAWWEFGPAAAAKPAWAPVEEEALHPWRVLPPTPQDSLAESIRRKASKARWNF